MPVSEPLTRVSSEYAVRFDFMSKLKAVAQILGERVDAQKGPGQGLGLDTVRQGNSKNKLSDVRAKHPEEERIPSSGVTLQADGAYRVVDIANPDAADGTWDPLAFAPTFAFSALEDSFPVRPGFDGNTDFHDDKTTYAHGEVGAAQPFETGFSVARKGEYTVLAYDLYMVDNKVACDTHDGDTATAQVYLKPGKDGKLAPAFLFTSWHCGGVMTPWADVEKDAQGHPMVEVGRGSHSLQPLSNRLKLKPDGGLMANGDGTLSKRGSSRTLANTVHYNAVQGNVKGADRLDPTTALGKLQADSYFAWDPCLMNPFHPSLFGLGTKKA